MSKLWAASLAAIVACATTDAHAAKYLIVDIAATGTGDGSIGSRTGARPSIFYNFTTFYASIAYNLEGIYPPQVFNGETQYVGTIMEPRIFGRSTATGFNFDVSTSGHFLNYNLSGKGCYANSTPTAQPTGSISLDPSCSQVSITYGDGFAASGYSFQGVVEGISFRVVEAASLPNTVFAIPEPTTWALMLAGFGLVGYAMRRRRPQVVYA